MTSALDVAQYVLEKRGTMTAMKLQKLVYYSHVWTIVWDEETLFGESVKAWANGAVIGELFYAHKGLFKVSPGQLGGDSSKLSDKQKENIDKVLEFYGDFTAQQLSDINHQEAPWIDARGDISPSERSSAVIETEAIHEYYSGLPHVEETQ